MTDVVRVVTAAPLPFPARTRTPTIGAPCRPKNVLDELHGIFTIMTCGIYRVGSGSPSRPPHTTHPSAIRALPQPSQVPRSPTGRQAQRRTEARRRVPSFHTISRSSLIPFNWAMRVRQRMRRGRRDEGRGRVEVFFYSMKSARVSALRPALFKLTHVGPI